jgi:cytochrome b561
MTPDGHSPSIKRDDERQRWSVPSIALHWLSAALILALLGIGWFMVHGDLSAPTKFDLYQLHKSLGFLSLAFFLLRLGARLAQAAPLAPAAMPRWERRLAGLAHVTFYVLLPAEVLSGWLLASAATIAIPMQFFGLFIVPPLIAQDAAISDKMTFLHYVGSRLLVGLIALHAAAALKHHLIDRDDVLGRMMRLR